MVVLDWDKERILEELKRISSMLDDKDFVKPTDNTIQKAKDFVAMCGKNKLGIRNVIAVTEGIMVEFLFKHNDYSSEVYIYEDGIEMFIWDDEGECDHLEETDSSVVIDYLLKARDYGKEI